VALTPGHGELVFSGRVDGEMVVGRGHAHNEAPSGRGGGPGKDGNGPRIVRSAGGPRRPRSGAGGQRGHGSWEKTAGASSPHPPANRFCKRRASGKSSSVWLMVVPGGGATANVGPTSRVLELDEVVLVAMGEQRKPELTDGVAAIPQMAPVAKEVSIISLSRVCPGWWPTELRGYRSRGRPALRTGGAAFGFWDPAPRPCTMPQWCTWTGHGLELARPRRPLTRVATRRPSLMIRGRITASRRILRQAPESELGLLNISLTRVGG
jgi:hypothetical protein